MGALTLPVPQARDGSFSTEIFRRYQRAEQALGCLIAYGINEDSMREPLDLLIADSETQSRWNALLSRLKQRGLKDIELVVSDNHGGLVAAFLN